MPLRVISNICIYRIECRREIEAKTEVETETAYFSAYLFDLDANNRPEKKNEMVNVQCKKEY